MKRLSIFVLPTLLWAMPAMAQVEGELQPSDVAAAETASTAPVEPAADKPLTLDEIIVTAQKRTEDVRDVPIAVSVMSGQEMRDSAITNFNELAAYIPNVSINTDWFSLYVRGIGTAEYSLISEQGVGYFVDGVYLGRIEFLRPGFVDVDQLEVLKGPQGTLFGRNAAAGVITVTTGIPSYEWTGDLAGTYGERGTLDVRGMISGPVIEDKVALRLAVSHNSSDGYIYNHVNQENMDPRKTTFARLKAKFDVTDNLTATAALSWFDYEAGPFGGTEATVLAPEFAPLFMALDPTIETNLDREGSRTPETGFEQANRGDGYIGSVQVDWDFWNHTLTSISSYATYEAYTGSDIDASGANIAGLTVDQSYSQMSQEVRFASPPGDFEYLVGLFYLHAEHEAGLTVPFFPNLTPGFALDPLLPELLDTALSPLLGPISTTQLIAPDDVNAQHDITIDSSAIFGQAKWHVLENLSLIFGLRYTYDDKTDHAVGRPTQGSIIWTAITQGGYDIVDERKDIDLSPKFSATWDPVEWATIYATYAKGFKAGSFNVAALADYQVSFDAEEADSYEAGVKTELMEGRARFNLAGHWTNYNNLQIATFQTVAYNVTNAPKARTRGVEADLTYLVAEGLVLNTAITWNQGTFEEFVDGPCPASNLSDLENLPPEGPGTLPPVRACDLSGKQLHRAPEWSGSARIAYRRQLGNLPVMGMIALDASYRDDELLDADLDPLDSQEAHWLFNGRLGLLDVDGLWSFTLVGKNLTDETTKVFGGDIPLFYGSHWASANSPRTVTGAFRVSF